MPNAFRKGSYSLIRRPPNGLLKPFLSLVWACEGPAGRGLPRPVREHMLPTGCMHLVFRMTDGSIRTFEPGGMSQSQRVGAAVVAGARTRFYVRERDSPVCTVGAVLRPGAARLLFGASALELSGRHTPLAEFWGPAADEIRERLIAARDCAARLDLLESVLSKRLAHVDRNGPAIGRTLAAMPSLASIEAAVRHSGLSHRSFIAHVQDAVGMAPKRYMRILRFQEALRCIRVGGGTLAMHAAQAGFSDQAHLSRDFLELSGVTPREYLQRRPVEANHLPVASPDAASGQIFSRPVRRETG